MNSKATSIERIIIRYTLMIWFVLTISGQCTAITVRDSIPEFSPSSTLIIQSLDLEPLVTQWMVLRVQKNMTQRQKNEYQLISQRIKNKLWQLQLQISAITSALDNEEERAEQVSTYLMQKQDAKDKKVTISAIAVGGITSVLSGLYLSQRNDVSLNIVGVIGGAIGVGLSLPSLFKPKKIKYEHPINPLGALYYDDNSEGFFPEVIWRFIHYVNSQKKHSVRDTLLSSWQQYGDLKNNVYFGKHGYYNAEELQIRASMLDQTEACISQMQNALSELVNTIIEYDTSF